MFKIDEDDLIALQNLSNKLEVFARLSLDGRGSNNLALTSSQLSSVFIEMSDQLAEVIHNVNAVNSDQ